MSVKRQSVAAGLRVVQRDRGAAGYALLRAAVSHVAGLGIADLGALVELGERGLLVEMLRGTAPAGSRGESFDNALVERLGAERARAFAKLVNHLLHDRAACDAALAFVAAMQAEPSGDAPC